MGLAGAGAADEHDVLCRVGERQRGQVAHQRLIDLGRGEVETGQVAMKGDFGADGLMINRYGCINEMPVADSGRTLRWPPGRDADACPDLPELRLWHVAVSMGVWLRKWGLRAAVQALRPEPEWRVEVYLAVGFARDMHAARK
jgi:hypothetical protein